MKVVNSRVYLDMPELPESKLELSPEFKKELKEEMTQKFDRLKVFAVGKRDSEEGVYRTDEIKVGDEVFVDPNEVRRAIICKIDGKEKIIVPFRAILHIW